MQRGGESSFVRKCFIFLQVDTSSAFLHGGLVPALPRSLQLFALDLLSESAVSKLVLVSRSASALCREWFSRLRTVGEHELSPLAFSLALHHCANLQTIGPWLNRFNDMLLRSVWQPLNHPHRSLIERNSETLRDVNVRLCLDGLSALAPCSRLEVLRTDTMELLAGTAITVGQQLMASLMRGCTAVKALHFACDDQHGCRTPRLLESFISGLLWSRRPRLLI